MNAFIEYILQFGNLNQQQIDFISRRITELEIHKDEYFSEAGKIPKHMGFLLAGILRVCYYNNKGEEITRYFVDEKNFVGDYINFGASSRASEYVQAVTDCKLLVISKPDWEEISDTIVAFDSIMNKIVQKCLIQKVRKAPLVSQDATTRYLEFIAQFPSLTNRIPLTYVASYLGITQQSLSRIRKNLR